MITRRSSIASLLGGSLLMPHILRGMEGPSVAPCLPKAKRVIWLYMSGGVSHVDTFDPKPMLDKNHGTKMPSNLGRSSSRFLQRSPWQFQKGGACGTEVSDLFPHMRSKVDEMCLIRSMSADHGNHFEAALQIHTGSFTFARPSIGSWVSYGLGNENSNLPSFVVIAPQTPYAGAQLWASNFLPGNHQGVRVVPGKQAIPNLQRQQSAELQQSEFDLLRELNKKHLLENDHDTRLQTRIQAYETAFGMQMEASDAFDASKESDATLGLYGLKRGQNTGFGWQCLMARRLAERGVRFIELIDSGASNNWDSHGNMMEHEKHARNVDQPIAGLLTDLRARGMLEDTLVVWTTEFGRNPGTKGENERGRDHHHLVFSSWLAGAGVRAGTVYGASDEFGVNVAENKVHVHDFHATILHLLGFNHEQFTYRHAGRDFRLTDVAGTVVKGLLS